MAETSNLWSFLLGLGSASAIFLVQKFVDHVLAAQQFRRLVFADIGDSVLGLQANLADLESISKDLLEDTLHYIWDAPFTTADILQAHSTHVPFGLFRALSRFYGGMGRVTEIQKAYNACVSDAIRQIAGAKAATDTAPADGAATGDAAGDTATEVTSGLDPLWKAVALACIGDLVRHYGEAIDGGVSAMRELEQVDPTLALDDGPYRELLRPR
jgi:hypothetical protein